MKIGIAINGDIVSRIVEANYFELTSTFEGYDVVLNIVGESSVMQASRIVAEGVNKPTVTGLTANTSPAVDDDLFLHFSKNELQSLRTEAGIEILLRNPTDTSVIITKKIITSEYDAAGKDTLIEMLTKAVRELVSLEKKETIIDFVDTPRLQADAGSSKCRIVELLKVVSNVTTQQESSTTI